MSTVPNLKKKKQATKPQACIFIGVQNSLWSLLGTYNRSNKAAKMLELKILTSQRMAKFSLRTLECIGSVLK